MAAYQKINRKDNLLINLSGGRSSAFSAIYIQDNLKKLGFKNVVMVFCNTGQERLETIEFLKNLDNYIKFPLYLLEGNFDNPHKVGYRVKNWSSLSMKSEPFQNCIDYLNRNSWTGVPNQNTPYCSDYLKTRPARAFAKDYFGTVLFTSMLGYRKEDIPKRVTLSALLASKGKYYAPMIENFEVPVGLSGLNSFWSQMPFKLELNSRRGNCKLCWKKSDLNLAETIQNGGVDFEVDFMLKNEMVYKNKFLRSNKSINDLVKRAENMSLSMFDDFGEPCGCGI